MRDISILICTCNPGEGVRATLDSIMACEVPDRLSIEVILVYNAGVIPSPEDVPKTIADQFDCNVHTLKERGLSVARNHAMAAATSNLFLWTDDDVVVPKDWIIKLSQPLINDKADAVCGGFYHPRELHREWMSEFEASGPMDDKWIDRDNPATLVGLNMAFHRRVLDRVPGYDEHIGAGRLGFNEDTLFAKQLVEAGYRIVSALECKVEHHFNPKRLERNALAARAKAIGRSAAYVDYHWHHLEYSYPHLRRLKAKLSMALIQAAKLFKKSHEGLDRFTASTLMKSGYWEQMADESCSSRRYEKHGLKPIDG